jgi:hypothetical protein
LSISPDGGGRGLLGIGGAPEVEDGVLRSEVVDADVDSDVDRESGRKDEEDEVEVDADLVEREDEDPDERYLSRSRSSSASIPCSRAEVSSMRSLMRSCSFSDSRRRISVSRSTIQSWSSIKANSASSDSVSLEFSEGSPSTSASSSLAPACPGGSKSAFPAIVRISVRRLCDKWKSGIAVAVGFVKSCLVGWGSWAMRVS